MPQTGTTAPPFLFGTLADLLHERALAMQIVFGDVGDVEHFLGGDQPQRFQLLLFFGREFQLADRLVPG